MEELSLCAGRKVDSIVDIMSSDPEELMGHKENSKVWRRCHAGHGDEGDELIEFKETVLERERNIILLRISSGSWSSIASGSQAGYTTGPQVKIDY